MKMFPLMIAAGMVAVATNRAPAQVEPSAPALTPGTQPATALATTQPVSRGVVTGRVTIATGWAAPKPDLSRAVVYLASEPTLDAESATAPAPPQVIAQRDKTFVPNFLVVPRGTEVEFPNWDRFDHNVFSRSAAAPAFDLDRYPYGQSKTRRFDKLGVVQIFCNIHPQMKCVVMVTPNRFFARVGSDGRFELRDVPAGRYELVVWHERCDEQRQVIEVVPGGGDGGGGGVADVAFTLEESRKRILSSSNPSRRRSSGVERGLSVKREPLNLPVVKESHPAPTQ
jgi:plastocyanin